MARFDRPWTTFYCSSIVTVAPSCTILELFDVERYRDLEIWFRGYLRSFKLVPFDTLGAVSHLPSIVTMAVYVAVCKLFSVKACEFGNWVRGRSNSLKMARFDRPYATFYKSTIVTIALSCTIFEFFDVK